MEKKCGNCKWFKFLYKDDYWGLCEYVIPILPEWTFGKLKSGNCISKNDGIYCPCFTPIKEKAE